MGWIPDFSGRQWRILCVFGVANVIAGIVYNIKGPLLPPLAESKGLSGSQYGAVFGIFDLTKVIACPVFGRRMGGLGPKRCFIVSMIVVGLASIAFGCLEKVNTAPLFLSLALLIRVVEGIGSAGFSTSAFSICMTEFPNNVSLTFASLETFFGFGLILGGVLSGVLYQIGGFDAPFIIVGVIMITSAIGIAYVMPHCVTRIKPSLPGTSSPNLALSNNFTAWVALSIPGVLIACFGVFTTASSAGFVNSTLEVHLRQFELNPVAKGSIFIIYGMLYSITAPIWGWIVDKCEQPKFILLAGGAVNLIAFTFLGPAPFFVGLAPSVGMTVMSLGLHGLALGAVFVSGFGLSLKYSVAQGHPNNLNTHGVVSGIWGSCLSLGMFCGPILGGFLLDQVGFRWGTIYVLLSMLCLIALILINNCVGEGWRRKKSMEDDTLEAVQPLINNKEGEHSSDGRSGNYGTGSRPTTTTPSSA